MSRLRYDDHHEVLVIPFSADGGNFDPGSLWALFAELPELPTHWRQSHWLLLLSIAGRKIPVQADDVERAVKLLNDAMDTCLKITRSEKVWGMASRAHKYVHGSGLKLWDAPDDREQFVQLHRNILERLILDRRSALGELMAGLKAVSPDAPAELVQIAAIEGARLAACFVATDMVLKAHETDDEVADADFEAIMKHTQLGLSEIEEIRDLAEEEGEA